MHVGLASTWFLGFSVDSSQDSAMNLLAWYLEGSLDLWAFQDSAKVYIQCLVHGKVVVTLQGGSFTLSAIQNI